MGALRRRQRAGRYTCRGRTVDNQDRRKALDRTPRTAVPGTETSRSEERSPTALRTQEIIQAMVPLHAARAELTDTKTSMGNGDA